MVKNVFITSALSGLLIAGLALAETPTPKTAADITEKNATKTDTKAETTAEKPLSAIDNLKKQLTKTFRRSPDALTESPIAGIYQVLYGTEVVYVSKDGKFFIAGDMINMETRENLSKIAQRTVRNDIIKAKTKDNKNAPIVFKAKDEKHVVKVFTDIDCPYCAKLHREVPELNENGITVEYFLFPRAGIGSKSYDKAVSVWCAGDSEAQQTAMTTAKERKPVKEKKCDNPVKTQYELGQEIGVSGTPALVTTSGRLIPGYLPADRLIKMLNADSPKSVFQQ